MNVSDGEAVRVSVDTIEAVAAACDAWALTSGAFDPTVHDSLVHLGYSCDLHTVRRSVAPNTGFVPAPGCGGIRIDSANQTITLPPGCRLDLGGIGKGLAADLITAELIDAGAGGAMVSVGGDVRARGIGPDGEPWRIEIVHGERVIATIGLIDGAVATSSIDRRQWRRTDGTVHHLVYPPAGEPTTGVMAATVIAGEGRWADALTKVLFASTGSAQLPDGITALVTDRDGRISILGPWPAGLELAA